MENGKEADSVQRQINRRTMSIKMTDNGIGRHFVQCVTQSCEERMISLKIPNLFHALAKSSKAPFVRDDIKLLTSQEWAVIEKDVRSENGRRGNQGAVRSIANQMMRKLGCCQHWWQQHPRWAAGCTKAEHRLARFLEISES